MEKNQEEFDAELRKAIQFYSSHLAKGQKGIILYYITLVISDYVTYVYYIINN